MAHYWKRDSEQGFIEDTAYIKYEKFNNLRHSIIGFMMGDFDQEGNYVVAPQVKRELIEMPKFLVESIDNIEICRSEIKLNKHISFMVTFEGNKATLSLLEKINYEANFKLNSGAYSNVNEYVLDEVETSGVINRNVIYDRWNIKVIGTHEVDIFNCDPEVLEKYFGIVRRFKYLMVANAKLLKKEKEIEEVESAYSNKVLNILKAYPLLNDAVLAEIKQSFIEKKKFVCADQPNFAKTLNEIIDTAITQNLDVLEEEQQLAFNVEHRNLIVETNIKRDEILDVQEKTQVLTKEDVKYNKKNGKENENESTLVEIIVSENELDLSVNAIAADFAKTQREVIETLKEEVVSNEIEKLATDKSVKATEKQELIEVVGVVVGSKDAILSASATEAINERKTQNTVQEKVSQEVTAEPVKKIETDAKAGKTTISNSWATNNKGSTYQYPKIKERTGEKTSTGSVGWSLGSAEFGGGVSSRLVSQVAQHKETPKQTTTPRETTGEKKAVDIHKIGKSENLDAKLDPTKNAAVSTGGADASLGGEDAVFGFDTDD